MVKAVLFDLGGVVLDISFNEMFKAVSHYSGKSLDEIRNSFSFDTNYQKFERGDITYKEYFESLRETLSVNITDHEFLECWNIIFLGEIAGMKDLLSMLSRKTKIYAFSNTNLSHYEFFSLKYSDILSHFKRVFLSFDLGKRKPEPESFISVGDMMAVDLNEILFFDDLEENVDAASKLGIKSVQVKSIKDIELAIEKYI